MDGAVRRQELEPLIETSERICQAPFVVSCANVATWRVATVNSSKQFEVSSRGVVDQLLLAVVTSGRGEDLQGYRFAGWELNLRLRRLRSPQGKRIEISRGELRLLCAFLSAPQRVLTRKQLVNMSRLGNTDVSDRAIKLQIMRVRRKLNDDPKDPSFIRSEYGVGYYFAAAVQIIR